MELGGWTGLFYRLSQWVTRLAYINILWLGFTFLGLIVLGFFPATAAMFSIVRKWLMGDTDISIFHTFWKFYREEFTKVNSLGFIMATIGVILYVDLTFFSFDNVLGFQIIRYGLIVVFFLYMIALIFFFPVYVHYNFKFFQYIKYSLLIGLSSPLITILMIVAVFVLNFTIIKIPGLIPFFSGSIMSLILMFLAYPVFTKIEMGKQEQFGKGQNRHH